jgi:hypothetical protein
MRKLLGVALAAAVLFGVGVASAQTLNTGASRLRMVRAYCTTGPCDPFFTFQGGQALIKRAKEPRLVTDEKFGRLRINLLQPLGGPPIPVALQAQVSGTIFYGNDLNAPCPLANTVVSGPFATSTMNCVPNFAGDATCSGSLFFTSFVAPECSDVSQVIQDLNIQIYEGGFVGVPEHLIATNGISILGKSPDCASGGAGCP